MLLQISVDWVQYWWCLSSLLSCYLQSVSSLTWHWHCCLWHVFSHKRPSFRLLIHQHDSWGLWSNGYNPSRLKLPCTVPEHTNSVPGHFLFRHARHHYFIKNGDYSDFSLFLLAKLSCLGFSVHYTEDIRTTWIKSRINFSTLHTPFFMPRIHTNVRKLRLQTNHSSNHHFKVPEVDLSRWRPKTKQHEAVQ